MTFPVKGKWKISQLFTSTHDAWDVIGEPNRYPDLHAPLSGVVVQSEYRSRWASKGWPKDNFVVIKLDNGKYCYMGHMRSRSVSAGQRVAEGQKIGVMGNTGYSSGPHTHLEFRNTENGKGHDPYPYFKDQMFWGNDQPSTGARTYTTYYTKEQDVKLTDKMIIDFYKIFRGTAPLPQEVDAWRGQDSLKLMYGIKDEANAHRANDAAIAKATEAIIKEKDLKLRDIEVALVNAKNKPAEKVIETVEKIVEVETVVEVQPSWLPEWLAVILKALFKKG